MKTIPALFALALIAGIRPAGAAEITIMEPADKAVVRGAVPFRIKAALTPMDQHLSSPDILVQDEYGTEVARLVATRDPKAQLFAGTLDTSGLKDGLYLVTVTYRSLLKGEALEEVREDLSLAVRNTRIKPAKLTVQMDPKHYRAGEASDVTVKVLDARGRVMPGARVTFTVDKGEVDSAAEISDRTGEAYVTVTHDAPGDVVLTITAENLPPVTQTIRYVK